MLTQDKKQINWKPIIKKFVAVLGEKGVVQRKEELLTYECDGLTSYKQCPPVAVLPRTTEQVSEIVKICNQYSVPFIARGSGTGLSGGALPTENSVLIVTSLMRQILSIDLENQRAVVQPGVINSWVTQAVSGAGFYFAPDPSSQIICIFEYTDIDYSDRKCLKSYSKGEPINL
jgi:glycolate oxidase